MTSDWYWERRRDLEGGKQLGVWLLKDISSTVHKELIVETHEYRGGMFDVHIVVDAEWNKFGDFKTADEAFTQAAQILVESDHEIRSNGL